LTRWIAYDFLRVDPEAPDRLLSSIDHSAAQPSTRAFVSALVRSYPKQTAAATLLILLASLSEAIGVFALIPLVAMLTGGNADPAELEPAARLPITVLESMGLPAGTVGLLVFITALVVLKNLFHWLAWRQAGTATASVATDMRLQLVSNLFRARWSYFTEQKVGVLANAVHAEAWASARAYQALCRFFAAALVALVYVLAVAILSLEALLLTVVLAFLLVAPLSGILRRTSKVARRESETGRNFVSNLVTVVQSMKAVRAMAAESGFERLAGKQAEQLRTSLIRQISLARLMPALQEPTLLIGIAAVLALGQSVLDFDFSMTALIAFALWRTGLHINHAHAALREVQAIQPYYWSFRNVLDASEAARETEREGAALPEAPIAVTFEQVTFGYQSTRTILDEVSFEIPAGGLTVLVGESGVGKSTVLDLVAGLQEPDSGRILINERPLAELSLPDWRRRLGYVPQETALFHGSLYDNVALGDESITEAVVWRALESAQARRFVDQLDHGLDTVVGEHGSALSGGQRQRIALARALARHPDLLLLDEFTASLDPETEARLVRGIVELKGEVTMVAATHQHALLDVADVIYRVEADGIRPG